MWLYSPLACFLSTVLLQAVWLSYPLHHVAFTAGTIYHFLFICFFPQILILNRCSKKFNDSSGQNRNYLQSTLEPLFKVIFFFLASLVVQCLRTHLSMQGTWVQALAREDPACRGATKPVRHNYWACALEPASHNYWSPRT